MIAALLLLAGCVLVVTGIALVSWPLALSAGGVLLLLAGIDLRR